MWNSFKFEKILMWRRKYGKIVNLIAILVVFATTYALILPALTLDQDKVEQTPGIHTGTSSTDELPTDQSHLPESTIAVLQESMTQDMVEAPQTEVSDASAPTELQDQSPPQLSNETASEHERITEPTTMVQKGDGYELTAAFDASAQFPREVELKVRELDSQSEEYRVHFEKAKEALGASELSYARFFDIQFLHDGQEVEPASPVRIHIKNDSAVQLGEDSKLKIVHFEENNQVEVVKAETKEENKQVSEVSFQADSFSIYGDVAADFYNVKFIVLDSDNIEQEIVTLIDIADGATITNLPDDPFKEGHKFKHWRDRKTGNIVTANTPVTENMVVEAVFEPIPLYTIKVNYFYRNKTNNQNVTFDSETFQLAAEDIPYRITPPASTKVSKREDPTLSADTIYYPQKPLIEITSEQVEPLANQEDKTLTIDLEFVPYTAEYDFVYLLKDLTGNGYTEIERVRAYGLLGSTVTAQVLNYDYAHFERTTPEKITRKSGQELRVYYTRKTFSLNYNSNGGDYIEPQTGLYKQTIPITTVVPKREGYDFVGWYNNKELKGRPVTGSVTLNGEQTLYAKWEPKVVSYRVVYFEEVYDNNTQTTSYVYRTTATKSAKVGTTVRATSADSIATSLPYHEVDVAANNQSSVVIQPDGSSVLNIYYKLKRYTLRFDLGTTNDYGSDAGLRLMIGGQTYTTTSGTIYEIKDVVLGQYIAHKWPSGTNEMFDVNGYYGFMGWSHPNNPSNSLYLTDRDKVSGDVLRGSDRNNIKTYTARWQAGLIEKRVEYYLQSANDPKQYDLADISQSFRQVWNGSLGQKSISGFTRIAVPKGKPGNVNSSYNGRRYVSVFRFYYQRETYTIDYFYKDSQIRSTGKVVRFDQNINLPAYNYIPPRPATVDADYTWGGWYSDPELRTKYNFGVMPAGNLALYANWIAPSYQVTFDLNGGNGAPPANQTIEKYKTATLPNDPSREHYDFIGWYTQPSGGTYYNWSRPVTGPVTLYARWKLKPLTYTVRYLEAGTNNSLAKEKVVTSPAFALNQTISEDALAITGYRPDSRVKDIQLNLVNNEIVFYYAKKAADIKYTVKYVLANNPNIEVAPPVTKTVPGSTIRVKETAAKIDKQYFATQPNVTADMLAKDYYPVINLKTLTLSSNDANNVLVFEYKDFETAKIKVNYLDMDGNPLQGQQPTIAYRKKKSSYVVNRPNIAGYTYEKSLDNSRVANKQVYRIENTNDIVIDLYYKKNLVITAQNKTKVYDGQALKSTGPADITNAYTSYLEPGDTLTGLAFDGSQTDVGAVATSPKEAVFRAGNKNRNYFYKITYIPATLTVTPRPVVVYIEGEVKDKVYDGKAETISYSIKNIDDSSGLFNESMIEFNGSDADKTLTKKDVGDYVLNLQNRFSTLNPNFSATFHASNGKLTIGKRHLILTSDSAEKNYDGSELRSDEIAVSVPTGVDYTGFVEGEGVVPTFLGGPTEPGFVANYFNYRPKDGTNLANYELDIRYGQLKVKEVMNIQKTDLSWQSLAGGKFELTKWDGINWAKISVAEEFAITSKEGSNIPIGLEPGRYRLQELAAPDGFIVLDSYIYFTIKDNFNEDQTASFYTVSLSDEAGNDFSPERARLEGPTGLASHRIKIANEQGRALPSTGGVGQKWFILSGFTLVLLASLMHLGLKRRTGGGMKPL